MIGITINTPIMSMKAVIISTHNFPALLNFIVLPYLASFRRSLAECGGRHGSANYTGQRNDGQRIGDHLHELAGNGMLSLEPDLERLRRCEQDTRERGTLGLPSPEDRCRQRDES